MERLNRLIGIVVMLQSRSVTRAEDIARHFGISARTVYRDLRALDDAGVPIAAEAGLGYSLVDGYHLPPVIFTREEASAISIGEKFVERFTDESLRKHMESALEKIRAVLPPATKNYVERLQESTSILEPGPTRLREVCANIATVQDALVTRKVLRVEYYANYRDSIDARDVEPLGMLYYGDNWHLIAYCRLREDLRDFRVDRIRSIEATGETFSPREEFTLQDYLDRERACREGGDRREVRILFTKRGARFAEDRHTMGLVEERTTPDGVEMTFQVHSLSPIARWVLWHGSEATVLFPDELRDRVRAAAQAIAHQHAST